MSSYSKSLTPLPHVSFTGQTLFPVGVKLGARENESGDLSQLSTSQFNAIIILTIVAVAKL